MDEPEAAHDVVLGGGGGGGGGGRGRRHESDDDRTYEDYSCKSPYERLVYDVEDVLGRWLDTTLGDSAAAANDAVDAKWVHAFTHGLHWRREPYVCALTMTRVDDDEDDASRATTTLGEWLRTTSNASTSVTYDTNKSSGDVYDFKTLFAVSCVLMVRPASATGRFVDQDESLTVRSAFTLAMSTLGVGGNMAVITPRGEYDREFSGDVSDDVNGDAVLETDVTRFTRFSTAEEVVERTYVGCVNRYLKQVRDARESAASADVIDGETHDIDNSIVSARITSSLKSSTSNDRDDSDDDALMDDGDIEDMRATLGDSKRKNVHEDLDSLDFGLFLDEWDDDAPWAPWVNMEDPWRSLALDAIWPGERLETMYAFSELNIDDAPRWFLRGDLTQAARDRGEEDDDLLSRDTSTLSEMLYELVQHAEFVADAAGLDTATLAGVDYWERNDMDVPSLPSEHVIRGVIRGIFESSSQSASVEANEGRPREPDKSAPRNTLLTRLALHACLLKNSRAVAHLWNSFTHELRYTYWERGREIPAVNFDPTFGIDHGACVLNQKLQILNQCILRRNKKSASDLQQSAVYVEKHQSEITAEWNLAGGGWSGGEEEDIDAGVMAPVVDELDKLTTLDDNQKNTGWGVDDDLDLNALLNDDINGEMSAVMKSTTRKVSPNSVGKTDDADEYASADEELTDVVDKVSLSNDDDMDDEDQNGDVSTMEPEGVREILTTRLSKPPHAFMRAPFTQEPAMYTEDMLAEREASMRALGDDEEGRAARQRIQSDELCSDMSAFKAANPEATFQDFVRWHSPKDWTPDAVSTDEFAPAGRLSARMRHKGNTWIELWRNAPRCPASRQSLIFDPVVEGERALHHLETVAASALFEQLVRCACVAILDIYASTDAYKHANTTSVAVKCASDTCSALFARENHAITSEDYDCAVFAVQLAERAAARAESLRKKVPDAPRALLDGLLEAASKWDTEREINMARAAHRMLTSECQSEAARSALRARLRARAHRSAEYLIHAPLHGSIPHHRVHVLITDAHTRTSRRISSHAL